MRNNIDILCSYRFEYIVLDESQNIKNSESLTFRSAIRLQSKHRLVLTGTPIENSLKDLWAQFHFIQPDLLGTESAFQKQFIMPIRQGNTRAKVLLQQLTAPFILRRSKKRGSSGTSGTYRRDHLLRHDRRTEHLLRTGEKQPA